MASVRTPFGLALAGLLDRRGLSIRAFARAIGDSEGLVRMVMRGRLRPPLDRLRLWLEAAAASPAEMDDVCRLALECHGAGWIAERWHVGRRAAAGRTQYGPRDASSR